MWLEYEDRIYYGYLDMVTKEESNILVYRSIVDC